MTWYYWVPAIIFFAVVTFVLVVVPWAWFTWSLSSYAPFPVSPELLYIPNVILLIIAGIIYWIGKRR